MKRASSIDCFRLDLLARLYQGQVSSSLLITRTTTHRVLITSKLPGLQVISLPTTSSNVVGIHTDNMNFNMWPGPPPFAGPIASAIPPPMPNFPEFLRPPNGVPPPGFPPQFWGSTRYVYRTQDGRVPNMGRPPPKAQPPGAPPMGPMGPPPPYPGMPCCGPPGAPFPYGFPPGVPPQPGMMCCLPHQLAPPAPAPIIPAVQPSTRTPQISQRAFKSTNKRRAPFKSLRFQEPPVINKVPSCLFHLIKLEPGTPKPWDGNGAPILGASNDFDFVPLSISVDHTVRQLLESIDVADQCPDWYPREHIGVTEGIPTDGGGFARGSSYFLTGGPCANLMDCKIRGVGWTEDRGEAGKLPPVILFLEP